MQEKREKILDEALKIIPFDGWTDKTFAQAAKNAKLPQEYEKIAFPKGVCEALELFFRRLDKQMLDRLKEQKINDLKVRQRIELAVKTRFEVAQPYKQAIRKAVSFYAAPHQSLNAAPSLWKTVDEIWYATGDKSSDFNYYTKRMTLAAVYSSTLLYWLNDKSKDHEDTWGFLKRRLENVMQFNSLKQKVNNAMSLKG